VGIPLPTVGKKFLRGKNLTLDSLVGTYSHGGKWDSLERFPRGKWEFPRGKMFPRVGGGNARGSSLVGIVCENLPSWENSSLVGGGNSHETKIFPRDSHEGKILTHFPRGNFPSREFPRGKRNTAFS